MLLLQDEGKALRTIMARRKPDGSMESAPMSASVTKDADGKVDPRHEAAESVIQAMHDGHAGKLVEALGRFHDLHASRGSDEPTVPEGPETEE